MEKSNFSKYFFGGVIIILIIVGAFFGKSYLQKGSLRDVAPEKTEPVISAAKDAVVYVAVNDYPDNVNKLRAGAYVNIYSIQSAGQDKYVGNLIETKVTSANGIGAIFTIDSEKAVDFVAFLDKNKAAEATTYEFEMPPYKNFSGEDGNAQRICRVNFGDFTQKMKTPAGELSCGGSFSYPAMDRTDASSAAVKVLQ